MTHQHMTDQHQHPSAALGLAIRAALDAGSQIMRIYNLGQDNPSQAMNPSGQDPFGTELKADSSPITLADKAAHATIMRHLEPVGLPILSEEGTSCLMPDSPHPQRLTVPPPYPERREWSAYWLVDPLDGTKEFIKRNGEFTVNIALIIEGRPHLGVVYAPSQRLLYYADPQLGAYRRQDIQTWDDDLTLPRLIQSSQRLPLPEATGRDTYTIVCSRSHLSPETQDYIEHLRQLHPNAQTLPSGSSLKICLVAEGTADIYPRLAPTMEWDTAAAHAIAASAGRRITDPRTHAPLTYNKPDLHNPPFVVE